MNKCCGSSTRKPTSCTIKSGQVIRAGLQPKSSLWQGKPLQLVAILDCAFSSKGHLWVLPLQHCLELADKHHLGSKCSNVVTKWCKQLASNINYFYYWTIAELTHKKTTQSPCLIQSLASLVGNVLVDRIFCDV